MKQINIKTARVLIGVFILVFNMNCAQNDGKRKILLNKNYKNAFPFQVNQSDLIGKWGEVNNEITTHRGKAGLIVLKIQKDGTFFTLENSDFGSATRQEGRYQLHQNEITFHIEKTEYINARKAKLPGKLSQKEMDVVTYVISKINKSSLTLIPKIGNTPLFFQQTSLYGF